MILGDPKKNVQQVETKEQTKKQDFIDIDSIESQSMEGIYDKEVIINKKN